MNNFKKILIALPIFIIVVVALTFLKLSMPSEERTQLLKKQEVVVLLNNLHMMKMDYAIKLITEDAPSGLADFNLSDYGLKAVDHIKIEEPGISSNSEYDRRIEFTSNQIIVTFGAGFDGNEEKTFILEAAQIGDDVIDWSCRGGSLSNKYRPRSCTR